MDWISIVQNSINEIEENIYEKLDADMLAREQMVSSYYFQKMFSTLCACTVGEYIRNRRLTLAGYEVLINQLTGGKVMMGDLGKRGYVVKETGAV